MGEIVDAMATCHAPYLLSGSGRERQRTGRDSRAMRELRLVLDETKPDIL